MVLAGEYFARHGCSYFADQCCEVYFFDDEEREFNVIIRSYGEIMDMTQSEVMQLRTEAEKQGDRRTLYVIDYLVEHLGFFNEPQEKED